SAYFLARAVFWDEYRAFMLKKIEVTYKLFGKPLFFLLNPEFVHNNAMWWGELFGRIGLIRWQLRKVLGYHDLRLRQKIESIVFANPVGLAAGYDYEAAFTRILPAVGFGFETVGTITYQPCEGNPE